MAQPEVEVVLQKFESRTQLEPEEIQLLRDYVASLDEVGKQELKQRFLPLIKQVVAERRLSSVISHKGYLRSDAPETDTPHLSDEYDYDDDPVGVENMMLGPDMDFGNWFQDDELFRIRNDEEDYPGWRGRE